MFSFFGRKSIQGPMNEDVFWKLLGLLNWVKQGDDDAVMAPAIEALSGMGVEDITEFQEILAKKLYDLDTEDHAREIGEYSYREKNSKFSSDQFLYQRCIAVINGREYYDQVLRDPKKMPKDSEFESVLQLAPKAYEKKTGQEWDGLTRVSFETGSNQKGWPITGKKKGKS